VPKLYGVSPSPYVCKVMVALAEKGIEYENVPISPMNKPADYTEKSPLGKIPCYEDGDFVLADSSCIIAYLKRVKPEPALYPTDAKAFGRALWLEEYADTKLGQTLLVSFFERLVRPSFLKEEGDDARVAESLEELPELYDYLTKVIGDRAFAVGSEFSVADIAIASPFLNFQFAGEKVDAERWPELAKYLEGIFARPSFQAVLAADKALFASMAG